MPAMASPMPDDDHLYGPLKDFRLDCGTTWSWGGKREACFSMWLFLLKGVKAGPLIHMGEDSEASPLLSLSSGCHVSLQLPPNSNGATGAVHQSESSIPLLRWSHVTLHIYCGRLRLLVDGRLEVDTLVGPELIHSGPLVLSGSAKRNDNLIHVYNPPVESKAARTEEEAPMLPVQLILSPRSQNPKTASGTDILEFRPTTLDGEQVFAVVGGKPSCRRKFVITVELVDARGRCVPREMDLAATLVFADSDLPVPSGGTGAEAPLLTTFDGVEFPSGEKPTRLVNGKASFKFTISQLASKCDNRLFSICFHAFPSQPDRPYLRLLSKPIHSISRKRPHKARKGPEDGRHEPTERNERNEAQPSVKRARKEAASGLEDGTESGDSEASETDETPVHHAPSRVFKPTPVLSIAERPFPTNDVAPAGRSPFAGSQFDTLAPHRGAGHKFHNEGGLVRTRTWPGGVLKANPAGVLTEKPPQGGGDRAKSKPPGMGEYRVPSDMGRKGMPSPQESSLTNLGSEAQVKRPPPNGNVSRFTVRIAAHAAVIRDCGLMVEREACKPAPQRQHDIAELRQRQADEFCQLQALLASRKVERAVELVGEERRIQDLEEQIEALHRELRGSIGSLRRKRQQLMDDDGEVHDILVTHLLPSARAPEPAGQSLLATSASSDVKPVSHLGQNLQTLATRAGFGPAPTALGHVALPPTPFGAWEAPQPRPPFTADVSSGNDVSNRNRLRAGGAARASGGSPRIVRTQPFLAQLADQPLGAAYLSHIRPRRIADVERDVEDWPRGNVTSAREESTPPHPLLNLMEQPHVQNENDVSGRSADPGEDGAAAGRAGAGLEGGI